MRFVAFTLALSLAGSALAQYEVLIDPVTEDVFTVPSPAMSHVTAVSGSVSGNTRTVVATMGAPVAFATGDGMIWKAYFNDDLLMVYCAGSAHVPNLPIGSGQVRLVRMSTRQVVGAGTAVVNGPTVTMSVTTLVSSPGSAVPANLVELKRVEAVFADQATIMERGESVFDWIMGSTRWCVDRPLMSVKFGLFDGSFVPGQVTRQRHPIRWDDRWTVPPGAGLPKPGDVDGDGRSDWKAGNDTVLGGSVTVGGWVSDSDSTGYYGDSMILVIGHDNNGNGVLELSEVTNIIGKCVFVPGSNIIWYEVIDGGFVVHMDNVEDTIPPPDGNGRWDPGERRRHYVYNTVTGILKVFDENGNLIYMGPPDGYWNP